MPLRRIGCLALALSALACQRDIPNQAPPDTTAFAVSFPDASDGTQAFQPPVPNDLVLQAAATPGATPTALNSSAAQFALLNAFAQSGGWPNDQEVPVQIQFFALKSDPKGGNPTPAPFPAIDTTTITKSTLAVVRYDTGTPTAIDFDVAPSDYNATTGVLTIHKKIDPANGTRWWPTGPGGGRYAVALRGGSQGVKTTDGKQIAGQNSTLLISQDKDLTQAENQGLLATQANPVAAAARLEQIRQLYATPKGWTFAGASTGWVPGPPPSGLPSALAAVDAAFPHKEAASLQTFVVDPSAHVAIDPNSGVVPLPSSLLMNAAPPNSYFTAAGGSPFTSKVSVPATGSLAPLAAGLNTLDGFGTTPMILVPTAGVPVAAASVTGATVVLLEKANAGASWTKVVDFTATQPAGKYLTLPPPITIDTATGQACTQPYPPTCAAELIGLQPAVTVPVGGGNVVTLPPLKEHAEYAVIVTSDVKDLAGKSITPGTVQKILSIAAPVALGGQGLALVTNSTATPPSGTSLLAGVPDAQAAQLQGLAGLVANELATDVVPAAAAVGGVAPAKVVTAYTFVTQSFTATAQTLAAAPTNLPGSLAGVSAPITPAAMAKKWGLPSAILQNPAPPNLPPKHFLEATLVTLDVLDPATGAFRSNPAAATPSQIPVLIAIPPDAAVPAGGAPLVVFRHGLARTRGEMLLVAGSLTGAGMVVVAIDAAKCGDRAWCTTDADCATGSTCDHTKFGDQGDSASAKPGLCTAGLLHVPLQSSIPTCSSSVTTDCWDGTGGISKASGSFVVSANLFRLRDTFRQDIVDEAALARAALGSAAAFGANAPAIDATKVFYVSHSLGSINGMVNLAAQSTFPPPSATPLFSRAVFSAGGGTFPDIGVESPSFNKLLLGVLASQTPPILPGSAAFLQFLQVAKWVHDPAEPVNYAATLAARPIAVLGMAGRCEDGVPNKEEQLFYGVLGKAPLNPLTASANPSMQWYMKDTTTACPADGSIGAGGATHSFVLDFVTPSLTAKAQGEVVKFLNAVAVGSTPITP